MTYFVGHQTKLIYLNLFLALINSIGLHFLKLSLVACSNYPIRVFLMSHDMSPSHGFGRNCGSSLFSSMSDDEVLNYMDDMSPSHACRIMERLWARWEAWRSSRLVDYPSTSSRSEELIQSPQPSNRGFSPFHEGLSGGSPFPPHSNASASSQHPEKERS